MAQLTLGDFLLTYSPVRPKDFIDLTDGIPFSYIKSPDTMSSYSQFREMRKETSGQKEAETGRNKLVLFKACQRIVSVCVQELYHVPSKTKFKSIPSEFSDDSEFITTLGIAILTESLIFFKQPTTASVDQAVLNARMAKEFGKTPIEMLSPDGGYSELDAYMYNRYAYIMLQNYGQREAARGLH